MHDPKKRQRDLAKRTLTYATMTISVIVLVAVSLFLVLGYSVDRDGQPEQGGLVQFRSFPTGATVHIDGAKQNFTTNNKKNTSSGYHNVTMDLKGYRGWSKNFDLGRGELLWLNALLIPKQITTESVQQFDQLAGTKASPDKNWIVAIENPSQAKLKIIDIKDEKKPKATELVIPAIAAKSKPGDVFRIVEWDSGSRYILVTHTSGKKTEWLRLDRSDAANARNISVLKNIAITDARFVGDSGNLMYVMTGGAVRKIDISDSREVPKDIAKNVKEFDLYRDDRIGYVANTPKGQVVSFYDEAEARTAKVRGFQAAQKNVHTAISNYFNEDYQAISNGSSVEVIRDPLGLRKSFAKFELKPGVKWLYFSASGRFVVAQNGSSLSVYDLERLQNFAFNIPDNPSYKSAEHLKWLDDYHLVSDIGGTLTIFEYDGTNIETIGSISQGFDVSLSSNGKRLFYIDKNIKTKKPALQSSVMVIE